MGQPTDRHAEMALQGSTPTSGPRRRIRWAGVLAVSLLASPARPAPVAFVTDFKAGAVSVVDTTDGSLRSTIPVGAGPYAVTVDGSGTFAYVANYFDDNISVIETATNLAARTIAVDPGPLGVALDPANARAYVSSYFGGELEVLDPRAGSVTARVPVGQGAYGVAVSPMATLLSGQPLNDGWELIKDSGLAPDAFAMVVLGVVGDELYVFGSQIESAGNLSGVSRYRDGQLTKISNSIRQDYNQMLSYGASEYAGKLYVGDRHDGKLYRLDLANDNFGSLTQVATVGGEDVFPGPVFLGKLWLGTFGRTGTLNPGIYSYDGSTVALSKEFASLGSNGLVTSIVPYGGGLVVSARNSTGSQGEMWASQDGSNWTLKYAGVPYHLAVWHGMLLGCAIGIDGGASTVPQFAVWQNDGWVNLTLPFGTLGRSDGLLTVGNEVLAFLKYVGVYAYDNGLSTLGLGAGHGGEVLSAKIHDGYLWVATALPVRLYRRPLASLVYVSNHIDDTVSVVDPLTNSVVGTVAVGHNPTGLAVSPDGTRVYVANYGSGTVSVIDTSNHTVTATIAVGANPIGVAVHPAGTSVYVTNYGGGGVSVIDTASNSVTTSVPVGANPVGVALTPDGARALVANYTDGAVSIIDTSSNGVVATATAGQGAAAFGSFVGTPGTAAGGCGAALPLGCDDGDMCTVDSCDLVSGCLHTAITGCCQSDVDCDDGDSCTTDTCNPGHACTHQPVGGMPMVSCRLDGLNEVLGTAVEKQLGGAGSRQRLERMVTKADENVSAPGGNDHRKALKHAINQLARFVHVVRGKLRRRTIDQGLAERLIALASEAIDQLRLLRSAAAQRGPDVARVN